MSIKGFMMKEKDGGDGPVTQTQAEQMIHELKWLSWGLVKIPLILTIAVGLFFLITFLFMKPSIENQQQQRIKESQIINQKR